MWLAFGFVLTVFFQIAFLETDRCMEKIDPGPCQYFQVKWFWDSKYEQCNEFHYGGCLGTRNRFNTKQECVKQCIFKEHNPVSIPDLCLLDPDPGHCGDERQGQWWYFFDAVNGICKQFFYYGCGGNHNKFYSLYQCRKVCGERLSPQVACDRCDVRTSTCQQNSKYNYTCECRDGFQKNEHNECADIDECRQGKSRCGENAWCENTVGGHKCSCMAGYVGDGIKCTYVGIGKPVDDCSLCSSNATCNNQICQCKVGFMGDGYNCKDTDECKRTPNPCDPMATCKNNEGSFTCACHLGYAGNGYNCTKNTKSCLDKFDRGYQESCGLENWHEHYYFDHTSKLCRLFWYDGCPGKSYNIFSDLHTCENMCERTHVLTRAEVCWDKFDPNYKNQCRSGKWQQRYYFDAASLKCRLFWYDGCQGSSRNMFNDLLTCQWLCEETPRYNAKSCLQPFDKHYRDECNGGRWRQQYFFDKTKKRCISFWYDGCKGESENIFQDETSCVQTCETQALVIKEELLSNSAQGKQNSKKIPPKLIFSPSNASQIALMPFRTEKIIAPSWTMYPSSNIRGQASSQPPEQDQSSNEIKMHMSPIFSRHETFETSFIVNKDDQILRQKAHKNGFMPPQISLQWAVDQDPLHHRHRYKDKPHLLAGGNEKNNADICEKMNPCQNNGTCLFDPSMGTYYCTCINGWTNKHCTDRKDIDPCASDPCQKGATCAAKVTQNKTTYECICMPDYGGVNCDSLPGPCDDNPCKNNGTCRPTPGSPPFFCDCVSEWGGKHCEIPIPKPKQPKYGKNVKLVSSGEPEWIEELKRWKSKMSTSKIKLIETPKDVNEKQVAALKIVDDQPLESSDDGYFKVNDNSVNFSLSENVTAAFNIEHSMQAGQTGGALGVAGKLIESGSTTAIIVNSLLLCIFAKLI